MREVSVPPVVTIDDAATLTDPVWEHAAATPDWVQFLRDTPAGAREVTCAEFRDQVVTLARGLAAAGVVPGARVGLMSRTRYEWTLVDYAVLACGAVTVPIYDTASEEQVAWTLSDAGATACVVETAVHADLVGAAAGPELPVWGMDAGDLEALDPSGVTEAEIEKRRESLAADDVATIVYTSGTTGHPKGCVITHRNLLTNIGNAVPTLQALFESEDASTLLFLPLAHSFARLVQFGAVAARTTLRHVPDPEDLAAELEQFRPTFVLAIPRVFEKVHDNARQQAGGGLSGALFARAERVAAEVSQARDTANGPGPGLRLQHRLFDRLVYRKLRRRLGGRCRFAISGGAPMSQRLAHFFRGVGLTVLEGYGLTETSPAVAVNVPDTMRIGTVGRPLPAVSVRIADDGEILVHGDVVFGGYWHNPEATAEVLGDDGWLHTGDLGELDADGFLTITGRKKDIIVTAAGKNVSPAPLEERLSSHPLISQSMLVGDQRPFVGALITIDEQAWPRWLASRGKPADATVEAMRQDRDLVAEVQEAVDDANRSVSRAEAIKRFRILPRDWTEQRGELTPTMKVKRGVVQEEYADDIDAIYRS